VRLLFQHACKPLDAYWLKNITDAALDARGVGGHAAERVGEALLRRRRRREGYTIPFCLFPTHATAAAGKPGAHHVLLKTHAWSDAFQLERATHGAGIWGRGGIQRVPAPSQQMLSIHTPTRLVHWLLTVFVTHRDLRQVLASFRRMTW
jgi:hypothetical protein